LLVDIKDCHVQTLMLVSRAIGRKREV